MTRSHELERDRQIADLRAVLRSSAEPRTTGDSAVARTAGEARTGDTGDLDEPGVSDISGESRDDGELDSRTLDGFGDGFAPPRGAWRARLVRQRGSAVLFVAVAVLAAAATALVTWLLRPAPTAVPASADQIIATSAQSDSGTVESTADSGGQSSSAATSAPPQVIVVAVVGQVASPGLVTLPDGARVSDAIAAAGGALPGTDLTTINIARRVADGEQIAVGVPAASQPGTTQPQAQAPAETGAKVNLNSATLTELDELPGIGPVTAQSIIDFREENGPFATVAELANVSGIGPATMAKLSDLVSV